MNKKLHILIGIILFTVNLNADAVKEVIPFGIEFNKPLNKSIASSDIADGTMKIVKNPPKPVSLFTTYAVSLDKLNKVTKVIGLGKTYKNDAYCFSSQAAYEA